MKSKPFVFYDVGELGWSLLLSARINFLIKKVMTDREIWIYTWRERFVIYRHTGAKLFEIPSNLGERFKELDQDGTHLYDHTLRQRIKNNLLTLIFKEYFKECGEDVEVCGEYGEFNGQRIFEQFKAREDLLHSIKKAHWEKAAFIFPRSRSGKFASRNLDWSFYKSLIYNICQKFPEIKIFSLGSKKGAYHIDTEFSNYVNLVSVNDDDKLEFLIACCLSGKVKFAIGSQSSLPKITLLCGIPTFMIGHERERHMYHDNWMNTKVGFYDVSFDYDGNYHLEKKDECLAEIISFCEDSV